MINSYTSICIYIYRYVNVLMYMYACMYVSLCISLCAWHHICHYLQIVLGHLHLYSRYITIILIIHNSWVIGS